MRGITSHIVEFYKGLFGHNEPCNLSLNSNFWPRDLLVSVDLIKPFSKK